MYYLLQFDCLMGSSSSSSANLLLLWTPLSQTHRCLHENIVFPLVFPAVLTLSLLHRGGGGDTETAWYNALEIKFLFPLRGKIKLCDLALRKHTGVGFSLRRWCKTRLALGDGSEQLLIGLVSQGVNAGEVIGQIAPSTKSCIHDGYNSCGSGYRCLDHGSWGVARQKWMRHKRSVPERHVLTLRA